MVKRYVLIDTDDSNPSDMDLELGPVYDEEGTVEATDAYRSASSADAYFADDPRATAFLALGSTVKTWYLARASKIIDNLPLKGRTYYDFVTTSPITGQTQDQQFPRYIDGMCYGWNLSTNLPEVPQEVKDACCEEALALYLFYADSDRTDRKTMAEDGVKSYNLGGVYSENLGRSNSEKHKGLLSSNAWDYLKGYIAGAVEGTL